ncbi:hypothetical protein L593_13360 [Salinarchaeum sp. Harcht-Bsk1]|uniref:DUF7549 family protein n=1 Tax=Salinarchaeum sp. Harcht-Bsk1 TaxID=1333523 RepID=UPI0003424772|nr:hypothetical protein [Salinarchaeum sp. Harcht-Bsk1]AGN02611.1 hypothetical protein L593_13360 [Salinarchaeum sp. Harcht-Bsk1]
MVWVKSEYAGELAVVSAWLSVLLPWYTSYVPEIDGLPGSVLFLRFPLAQIRFTFGVPFAEAIDVRTPMGIVVQRADTLESGAIEIAYWVWYVGAALVVLAVVLSVVMYVEYEQVLDALPVHPVRVMGALLTGAGLVLALSTGLFYRHRVFEEYPVPIGLVVMLLLGGSLLRVELLEDEQATDASEPT